MSYSSLYTLSTPLVEGVGRVSRSTTTAAMFWLARTKVGCCPIPLMVCHHSLLHLEGGLALVYFGKLGLNYHSLTDEFTLLLHGPTLDVGP
jgi:hypothetical protein